MVSFALTIEVRRDKIKNTISVRNLLRFKGTILNRFKKEKCIDVYVIFEKRIIRSPVLFPLNYWFLYVRSASR